MSAPSRELELFKYYCAKSGERVNYNKAKWAIRDLLVSYEYNEIIKFIDFYVRVCPEPQWKKFQYNIDQIARDYDMAVADRRRRQKLRDQTRKMVGADER